MNILYCGDVNIQPGVLISAISLLRATERPLNIHIMTAHVEEEHARDVRGCDPVTESFVAGLQKLLQSNNPSSTAELHDVTEQFSAEPPTANMSTRFTPCCMLRLYADLVDGMPDKLLYLDCDVVVRKDIDELYDQDLEGHEVAGVLDYYGRWFFHNKIGRLDYMNSGVLLLNMKMIRDTRLFARCRKMCAEKPMFMPDQSALNGLSSHRKILPRRFNEQRILRKDTALQHFTTSFRFTPWFHAVSVKPWDIKGMHEKLHLHEYDEVLEEYQQLEPVVCRDAKH
jgi:lipopolysaccharide biosynthesis glycosyltransferase